MARVRQVKHLSAKGITDEITDNPPIDVCSGRLVNESFIPANPATHHIILKIVRFVLTPQDFFLGGPGEPLGIFIKMRELQRRSCCWCASRRMVKGKWHIFMSQSPPSRPFGWTFNLLHSLFSIVICQPFQNCYLMVCTFKVRFMYTFSISFSFLEWHSWNINLLVFSALLFDGCCGCVSYTGCPVNWYPLLISIPDFSDGPIKKI